MDNYISLSKNNNTGIEYEYALYMKLVPDVTRQEFYNNVVLNHRKKEQITHIYNRTNASEIFNELARRDFQLSSCVLETQNDEVGPSDLIMHLTDSRGIHIPPIGLSVKYANSCTLNVTGKKFLTKIQIAELKAKLQPATHEYIREMTCRYGNANNWFRKGFLSKTTDKFIDLIRDEVIKNWETIPNKEDLVMRLFQMTSPIEYWVYEFKSNRQILNTLPPKVDIHKINSITVQKLQTSYIAFYLEDRMIGKMQIKFNNGFLEKVPHRFNPQKDIRIDGIEMRCGKPFGSWNFSVIY